MDPEILTVRPRRPLYCWVAHYGILAVIPIAAVRASMGAFSLRGIALLPDLLAYIVVIGGVALAGTRHRPENGENCARCRYFEQKWCVPNPLQRALLTLHHKSVVDIVVLALSAVSVVLNFIILTEGSAGVFCVAVLTLMAASWFVNANHRFSRSARLCPVCVANQSTTLDYR